MFPHSFDPKLVGKFGSTNNEFLQVLVDRFRIQRVGSGFELNVAFTDESPCIWKREARKHILEKLHPTRRLKLQERIDAFLNSDKELFSHQDSTFPFRIGNGGTLPVVRLKGIDYYCFFFREAPPTGWNIANGEANTHHELLHADAIVERELREELIVVEPEIKRWYVFDWHEARLRDHPDFAEAQRLWKIRFSEQGYNEFEEFPLPLKWSVPPDEEPQLYEERYHDTMQVLYGNEMATRTGRGFLNINAEDFGIEFDRIAKLSVGPGAVFCDGELRNNRLLNRVVGLFEAGRVQKSVASVPTKCKKFTPDKIFWDGLERTGDELEDVIDGYLRRRGSSWTKFMEEFKSRPRAKPDDDPLNLCPVTRTIVNRHGRLRQAKSRHAPLAVKSHPFEVFVSFASEDVDLARKVYDQITASNRNAFFSHVTMTCGGFADQIDNALDSAKAFVAVGSQVAHLHKSWVKYEWRNFHSDMNAGRKLGNSPFFAFVTGIDPNDLPRPLRDQQAIVADGSKLAAALKRVTQRISRR